MQSRAAAWHEDLDRLFAQWNVSDAPGLAIGVLRDGLDCYRRGFGLASLEAGVRLTPRTRMRIGSTSKHFIGLLATMFADRGLLDLDISIRHYLPELKGGQGRVTIRDLLRHRAGTRCAIDLAFLMRGNTLAPPGTNLKFSSNHIGMNFPPGEMMIYNNGGYHLVSRVLERRAGEELGALLKREIFDPVGMIDTALQPSDMILRPGVAGLHVARGDYGWRRGIFPSEEILGEGGIVSTVNDMLRWAAELRRPRVLPGPSVRTMLDPAPLSDGGQGFYGLGIVNEAYRGIATWSHSGGVAGGSSQMLIAPDAGIHIVILSNGAPNASPTALARKVLDLILSDDLEAPPRLVSSEHCKEHGGLWASPSSGMTYYVETGEKHVSVAVCSRGPGTSIQWENGSAVLRTTSLSPITFSFETGDDRPGLTVEIEGRREDFRHLAPAASKDWATAVAGYYEAETKDCWARIASGREGATAIFSDVFGQVKTRLIPFGDNVAITEALHETNQHAAALTFRQDDEGPTFVLNSSRTRNLRFRHMGEG